MQAGGDMSQLKASIRKLEGENSYSKKQQDLYKQRVDEMQRKLYETEVR